MCDKLRAHFLGQPHRFGSSLARFPFRSVWPGRLTRLPDKTWMMHIEGEWIHQMPGVVFLKLWDAEQVEVLFFSSKKMLCGAIVFWGTCQLIVNTSQGILFLKAVSELEAHAHTSAHTECGKCHDVRLQYVGPSLCKTCQFGYWISSINLSDVPVQRAVIIGVDKHVALQSFCGACRKGWLQLLLYVWVHPWWWGSDVCPPCLSVILGMAFSNDVVFLSHQLQFALLLTVLSCYLTHELHKRNFPFGLCGSVCASCLILMDPFRHVLYDAQFNPATCGPPGQLMSRETFYKLSASMS